VRRLTDANVFYPMIIEILILQERIMQKYSYNSKCADKDEFENNKVAKEEIFKLNIPQDSFVILTVGSHTGLKA
jgi:hypothetical protein